LDARLGTNQVKIDTQTRLACKDASTDVIVLPASTKGSAFPFSGETFSYLQYELSAVGEHQFVAVVEYPKETPGGFVVAEFYDTDAAKRQSNVSLSGTLTSCFTNAGLLTHGLHTSFPMARAVTTELNIPSLESSLLAYKLQVNTHPCATQLFRPFVRQSIAEPYESKFFVDVHDADLNLHGLAPYLVPQIRRNGAVPSHGVTLQFWTDPSCESPLDIQIKFDLMGSFGKTFMRYRIVLAAFPLAIVALCLKRQFSEYNTGGMISSSVSKRRLLCQLR
jgi:glycosylphosphatidylinositol deacylase